MRWPYWLLPFPQMYYTKFCGWIQIESSFKLFLFRAIILILDTQEETFAKFLLNLTMREETKTERPNALLIRVYGLIHSTQMLCFLGQGTISKTIPTLSFKRFFFSGSRPSLALLESFPLKITLTISLPFVPLKDYKPLIHFQQMSCEGHLH